MRRISRSVAVLLCAAAAAVGSPARADEADRTKTFADHNFRLTIPEEWRWEELSEVERDAGFVAVARRTVEEGRVEASARVRVVDAAGSTLESLMALLKDAKSKDLTGVVSDDKELEWAGVPARRLDLSGKHEGGGMLAFEVYGAIVSGKFHQLDLRCVNGAEEKIRGELNDLAASYALLEAPAGAGEAGPPPQSFPQFSLTWTLPKATTLPPAKEGDDPRPVRWGWGTGPAVKPDAAPGTTALLAAAFLAAEGPAPVVVELHTQKAPVGMTAQAVAEHEPNFQGYMDDFSGIPAPRIDREAEIGNLLGASRSLNGKDKQDPPRPLFYRITFVVLKDWLFHTVVRAHDDAESTYRAQIRELIAGLQWGDAKQGIRGPRVTPFLTYTDVRKDGIGGGKETPVVQATISLKKPASFAQIKFDATVREYADYQFTAEARREGVYAWVGIKRWPVKAFTDTRPPKAPETLIDDHEGDWKNEMDDPVTMTQRGGKQNKVPETLGGLKGHTYEFRGVKEKAPWTEKGWVVKDGLNVFHVRVQYGGKDAEAAFATDVKAMLKSLKFGK
jgi:hypothetical protein